MPETICRGSEMKTTCKANNIIYCTFYFNFPFWKQFILTQFRVFFREFKGIEMKLKLKNAQQISLFVIAISISMSIMIDRKWNWKRIWWNTRVFSLKQKLNEFYWTNGSKQANEWVENGQERIIKDHIKERIRKFLLKSKKSQILAPICNDTFWPESDRCC